MLYRAGGGLGGWGETIISIGTRYEDEADRKMATQQETEFDNWLCEKLKSLQLDEEIFLEYLKGVLEEDSSAEEKVETISGILEGATVS